jgi:hypothetical protein
MCYTVTISGKKAQPEKGAKMGKSKNKVVTDLSTLSEQQLAQVAEIKAAGGEAEVTKCHRCGKLLIRDKSIEQEAGDLCYKFDEKGITEETLMAHRATMTLPAVPEGYISVADLHRICQKHGIPVHRMVMAIGGDRSLNAPLAAEFTPVFVKGRRYVPGESASKEGLAMLRGNRPTKDEKAKAEVEALAKELATA